MHRTQFFSGRTLSAIGMLLALPFAAPALAHHAMGGQLPANGFQGFLSGLAHPVIGLDHLAGVIAVGLLAATQQRGFWLPVVFLAAALAGTGIHSLGWNLPALEIAVSGSVLLVGMLLAMETRPKLGVLIGLGAVMGLFHGYAYGESIVGAEPAPLFAYLLGFTLVQLLIALLAWRIGRTVLQRSSAALGLRFAGFTICGVGAAFLSSVVLDSLLPV
ncbi:MAG: HupE/UreJ family protein [Synechococcales cyanobacterium M58_A2018_015]|nr:HupE/UreJ family protein [Synechococcales cyanobacterium M58_A2018_015]